jgi:putative membrane protein
MISLEVLTQLSTGCIVTSGISLLVGWYFVRTRQLTRHRSAMLLASSFAALFLVFYVTRWAMYGSKAFPGTGGWKAVYFVNLVPHIIFAMVLAPLVIRLLYLALGKRDFVSHRRLARYVLPMWLYVSASGWLIYYLLYVKAY